MNDLAVMDAIAEFGVPDHAIDSEKIPWVPQAERVWFKPLRFDLATGRWINLLKVATGGVVSRHQHLGGQVLGFCLEGSWRYAEREWVARPGTLIYEPPGDIHTLVVDDPAGMVTLFYLEGVVQYLNDDDSINHQDDIFSKMEHYYSYCRAQGIAPVELRF